MAHPCNWPKCSKETDYLMCSTHWYRLPPQLRQRLMKEYVGKRFYRTEAYNQVVKEIEAFVASHGDK